MSGILVYFSILLTSCLMLIIKAEDPIVETSHGKISGTELVTIRGKVFHAFEGIPFAAPPLGELRFSDPQPPEKWTGVKKCTNSNIICVQITDTPNEFETEDCLTLNTYTPKLKNCGCGSGLPVMVYFYGGSYIEGNATHDSLGPEFLIDRDVIVVTVNYRLGPFGFLSTGDPVIPGNYGLKDQTLALKWVRNNIAAFGGDPDKVMIFGVSSGASSVGLHLLSDHSQGLFRAAALCSGTPVNSFSIQLNPKKFAYLTAQYVNASTTPKNSKELLHLLRGVSTSVLKKAGAEVLSLDPYQIDQAISGCYYAPVYDTYMENGFVTRYPHEAFATGDFNRVPVMMGITSEETLALADQKEFLQNITEQYDQEQKLLVTEHFRLRNEEEKNQVANLLYKLYTEDGKKPLASNPNRLIRFFSDQSANNGAIKHADKASKFTDVFLYEFSYDGLMGNFTQHLTGLGGAVVAHLEDINYIFRRNLPSSENLDPSKFPKEDQDVQNILLSLYTNFAKYLNPTPTKKQLELQNIEWGTATSRGPATYLDINSKLTLKSKLKFDTYVPWNDIFKKYAKRPYDFF